MTRTLLLAGAVLLGASASAQCSFTLSLAVTNPTCGANDGAIDLTINPPGIYYIYWSDGPTTEDRTGLGVGFYEVTVYDNSGSACGMKAAADLFCETKLDCRARTQTMGGWGANPQGNNPAMYLQNHFASCFPNGVTIGCASGHTLTLTTSTAVKNFLPAGSTASQLTGDLVNPLTSPAGVLAGQLTAAVINVTVDACDPNFSAGNVWTGDLVYNSGPFSGWTVWQVIDAANQFIGGCGGSYTAAQFNTALTNFNENYDNGNKDNGHFDCVKKEELRSMTIEAGSTMSMFPNPTADRLNVTFNASTTGAMSMTIVDLTGRVVMELGTMSVIAGERRTLDIETDGLNDGSYMLVTSMGGQQLVERFVVKH